MRLRLDKKILLSFLLLAGVFVIALPVFAQVNTGIEFGQYTGLTSVDIRVTIAKIIRVALGLLGIVALGLVIYGGVEYMTAEGNEEQIAKAKKILLNAAIGLAIILSAFAITQFVINQLTEATLGGPGGNVNVPTCVGPDCDFIPGGGGALYSATTPQGQLPIKNVVVSITFFNGLGWSAAVDPDSINAGNIKINKLNADGSLAEVANGEFRLLNGNTKTEFHPNGSCVDPAHPDDPAFSDPSNTCFEKNTTYRVELTTGVLAANKITSLTCNAARPCVTEFTTGDSFDRLPPTAAMIQPGPGAVVMEYKTGTVFCPPTLSADFTDDGGVKEVTFYSENLFQKTNQPITSKTINPFLKNGTAETNLWLPFLDDPTKSQLDNVYAQAFDLDDHSATSVKQQVKVLPATCYNGQLDGALGEEQAASAACEPDCGAASQCGACPGGACQTNLDCAGTYCDPATKTCVARPKITNVVKKDGAVGNYVTLYGSGFGMSGNVIFGGDKLAVSPSCGGKKTWGSKSAVVEVPAGAVSGPLEIRVNKIKGAPPGPIAREANNYDLTNDDWGPNFPAADLFVVNNTVRPGLCGADPNEATPGAAVGVSGNQLGAAAVQPAGAFEAQLTVGGNPTTGRFKFGDYLAQLETWTATVLTAKTPNLPPQYLTLQATVGSEESNSIPFTVLPVAPGELPRIDYINPENGPPGSYVTIVGSNFGASQPPRVYFGATQALPPADCSSAWSATQIIVKVPDGLPVGTALVRVNNLKGDSNNAAFTVDSSPLRPGLCSLSPDNGPENTPITLTGEGFGAAAGDVEFWKEVPSGFYTFWSDANIASQVPPKSAGPQTGPVKVKNAATGLYSNSLNFKIQNCKTDSAVTCATGTTCCDTGSCEAQCGTGPKASVYSWKFSTGRLPSVPKVVEDCGANIVPSPTPSEKWPPSDSVCINAQIKTRFSTLIKQSTVNAGSFVVETCTDVDCAIVTPVTGGILNFSLTNGKLAEGYSGAVFDTITYTPPAATNNLLAPNTWYRVRLGNTIQSFVFNSSGNEVSELEATLPAPYTFKFKTRNNSTLCRLGSAVVSPDPFSAKEFDKWYLDNADNNQDLYSVTALADENVCWALNANAYDWEWNAGVSAGSGVTSDYANLSAYTQKMTTAGVVSPTHEAALFHNPDGALLSDPESIGISGNKAFIVSYSSNALNLVDISNPSNPLFKKRLVRDIPAGILLGGPRALSVVNDLIYIVSQNSQSLEIFRSTGDTLAPLGKIVVNTAPNNMKPQALSVAGSYAYVMSADPDNALYIFNVANPADIRLTSVFRNADFLWPRDVAVSGNFAYLVSSDFSGHNILWILDISRPSQPTLVGQLTLSGSLRRVAVKGNYVYVASVIDLYVVDVSVPAAPILKNSAVAGLTAIYQPTSAFIDGNYLYITDSHPVRRSLYVINISDPIAPVLAGSVIHGYGGVSMPQPSDVAVSGEYAYVVSEPTNGNLEVVRIFESVERGKPHQDVHTNNQNKETLSGGEKVWAKTTSGGKTVADNALLYIKLTNPRVLEKWPDCNAACVNAEVGAQFNVELDMVSANISNVKLCWVAAPGADCSGGNLATAVDLRKQAIDNDTLVIISPDLLPGQYYRVIFSGNPVTGLKSGNGIEMDQSMGTSTLNYRVGVPNCLSEGNCDSHSWTFRTKTDAAKCAVAAVDIQPPEAVARWVGAQAGYFSVPRGSKDACSPFGQRLNGWDYSWVWNSADTDVAIVSNFDSTSTVSNLCNSSCVRSGQTAWGNAPLCGNNIIEAGEDCDPPTISDAPGAPPLCTAQCLDGQKTNLGTLVCAGGQNKDCCGNSIVEANEDCDAGTANGQAGSGCAASCLHTGTPISRNKCQAAQSIGIACDLSRAINVCGDGIREPDEECDAGVNNGKDGFGCTLNCLSTAMVYGTTAGKCGNGIIDNAYEECDGGRACTRDCQNAGASLEYGSFCGDGAVSAGEDSGCDVVGAGDGKVDPWQLATAVGNGTFNAQNQQVTNVTVTAPTGSPGSAKFVLQCGYEPVDGYCPGTLAENWTNGFRGVGTDSCCYTRPWATVTQPATLQNVCPNTVIKLEFNDLMDKTSFTNKVTGAYNIALWEYTAADTCPAGQTKVVQERELRGSWQKAFAFARRLIGLPAAAWSYCDGAIDYTLSFAFVTSTPSTEVSLNLKQPLAFNKIYRIALRPGIKTVKGVSLNPFPTEHPWMFGDYRVKDSLCKIEKVTIDPKGWLFNTTNDDSADVAASNSQADATLDVNGRCVGVCDGDKIFTAKASYLDKTIPDSPPQELQPLAGIYDWRYNWSTDDTTVVNGPSGSPPSFGSEKFVAQNKNGLAEVGAAAIDSDEEQFAATSTVQVFLCNNPWPNNSMNWYGLGWADVLGKSTQGRGWTNFKLLYCRDLGKENDPSDDLPKLRTPTVLTHETNGTPDNSGIFKEFFMTFESPDGANVKVDRDSVGVRVYPNLQHLTLLDWYNSRPNVVKGVPVPTKVGKYDALQEGRTFYVSGLNRVFTGSSGGVSYFDIYSNIFVFSFSNDPTPETLNIVNQLMANLDLNIGWGGAGATEPAYRDFKRIQDLQLITKKLGDYYQKNGFYPNLTSNPEFGTFLPSYTNSKWRSWQGVLGNALGYNLPIDPQNGFNGCGTSTLSMYNAETCWDATISKFICPLGSRVYQYETKGGASATLKADFELPSNYDWVAPLDDTRPPGLVTTLQYQTVGSCNSGVQGVGKTCGDGIISPPDNTVTPPYAGETCEIGQKRTQSCTTVDGYAGLQTQNCKSDCSDWGASRFVCDQEDDALNGNLGRSADSSGITTAIVTSVKGKSVSITEYATSCPGALPVEKGTARLAACNAYWTYNFDFPADGKYGFYVKTSNGSDLNDPALTETAVNNSCPQAGIQQHLVISLDGIKVGEVCAEAVIALQTNWVSLGNVKKGRHTLKVEWDNDWYSAGVGDSNIEINKIAIARGCHEETSGGGQPVCVPQGRCGDGVLQSPKENCDDGANNGKYGYCNNTCSGRATAGYCGNRVLDAGKEMCDSSRLLSDGDPCWAKVDNQQNCGKYVVQTYGVPPFANTISFCGDNNGNPDANYALNCASSGGKYNREKAKSCSWDCQSYDYCGDGRVNSNYEECEKSESCQVGACSNDPTVYCETDANCGANNTCQNKQPGKRFCRVPGEVKPAMAMVGYCSQTITKTCEKDSDCPAGETCPDATKRPLFRNAKDSSGQDIKYGVEAKADCGWAKFDGTANKLEAYNTNIWAKLADAILRPEAAKAAFNFNTLGGLLNINWLLIDWNTFDWSGLDLSGVGFQQNQTCLPLQAPPPAYQVGNCGNGTMDAGEVCDDGINNGQICTDFSAAGTCTYCAYGCQQVITVQQP